MDEVGLTSGPNGPFAFEAAAKPSPAPKRCERCCVAETGALCCSPLAPRSRRLRIQIAQLKLRLHKAPLCSSRLLRRAARGAAERGFERPASDAAESSEPPCRPEWHRVPRPGPRGWARVISMRGESPEERSKEKEGGLASERTAGCPGAATIQPSRRVAGSGQFDHVGASYPGLRAPSWK